MIFTSTLRWPQYKAWLFYKKCIVDSQKEQNPDKLGLKTSVV